MSLFQCSRCGCMENTSLSNCSRPYIHNSIADQKHEAILSYKQIMGLKPEDNLEEYCSACSPVWYTDAGDYGVGPIPEGKRGKDDSGKWHGKFRRIYLPMGEFETNNQGNLWHKKTHEYPKEFLRGYISYPKRFKDINTMGWYIQIDFNHQKGKGKYGEKPYGGWFYEKTPEGWRDETGCLDCGPFDDNDLFIGPVAL